MSDSIHNQSQAPKDISKLSRLGRIYLKFCLPIYYYDVLYIPVCISFALYYFLRTGWTLWGSIVIIMIVGTWFMSWFNHRYHYPKHKLEGLKRHNRIISMFCFIVAVELWAFIWLKVGRHLLALAASYNNYLLIAGGLFGVIWMLSGAYLVNRYLPPRGIRKHILLASLNKSK